LRCICIAITYIIYLYWDKKNDVPFTNEAKNIITGSRYILVYHSANSWLLVLRQTTLLHAQEIFCSSQRTQTAVPSFVETLETHSYAYVFFNDFRNVLWNYTKHAKTKLTEKWWGNYMPMLFSVFLQICQCVLGKQC